MNGSPVQAESDTGSVISSDSSSTILLGVSHQRHSGSSRDAPITNGISRWSNRARYTIDIFCCRSPEFCSITDFPREFFQT